MADQKPVTRSKITSCVDDDDTYCVTIYYDFAVSSRFHPIAVIVNGKLADVRVVGDKGEFTVCGYAKDDSVVVFDEDGSTDAHVPGKDNGGPCKDVTQTVKKAKP